MPFPCSLCNKKPFETAAGLEAHMANTKKHASQLQCFPSGRESVTQDPPTRKAVIECTPCNKKFVAQEALNQHLRDSPAHRATYPCIPCNETFATEGALDEHILSSPAHRVVIKCTPCNREFGAQEHLDQHLRDSPAHRATYPCIPCNETFATEGGLDEHVLSSPVHNPPAAEYSCRQCNRSFGSNIALGMHMGSSLHVPAPPPAAAATTPAPDQTSRQSSESLERPETPVGVETPGTSVTEEIPNLPETPLDVFFQSFPLFPYDRTNSPECSYGQLKDFLGLEDHSAREKKVWMRYQAALTEEVDIWFGDASDIHAWHHLCKAVGVRDPPPEIKDCKKVSGYFLSIAENSENTDDSPTEALLSPLLSLVHYNVNCAVFALLSWVCYYVIFAVFGLLCLYQCYTLMDNVTKLAYLAVIIPLQFLLLFLCFTAWIGIVLKLFPSRFDTFIYQLRVILSVFRS